MRLSPSPHNRRTDTQRPSPCSTANSKWRRTRPSSDTSFARCVQKRTNRLTSLSPGFDSRPDYASTPTSTINSGTSCSTKSPNSLRRKLLEKEDMTLDDALKICRSWEATAHQTAQMSSSATSSATTTVHAVAHSSQQQRRKWNQPRTPPHREEPECPNCGYGEHKAGQSCPAKGQTCLKCGKRNHFSRKCQSGRSTGRTNSTRSQPWRRHQPRPGRAHHVTDRDDTRTDSNDFETVFTVGQTVTTPTPRVTIRISEAETTAIVDSGASCNLLGTDQLASLRRLGLQTTLVPCKQALYAYGSTQPLKLAGQFTVPTSINGKTIPTTFVVIDGPGDILLGKTSSELFGAIHFDTTLHTNSVTNEDQAFRLSLQQHFPAVFEGVGKLRGHQTTIHIDPTVTPVAQRPRRVPFALRPKVRDHLKDLMEKDIIEKVDGPSPWVSPVVVTPKPNGDIRLCVDMRRANEAIIRERHPIPTIDEDLEQLNGSTVFSKIDLRWGFHQVELSEDSRSITTFALDENLYRYKRMMFGITSARIERWVLRLQPYDFEVRYTPGTTNIADALSRMPVDSADDEFTTLLTEESVRFVTKTAVPNALTAQQVEQASRIDPELCNIRKCLESGQLDSLPKPFLGVRHELTYVGFVVIRGTRIVPPASLRDRILELAHEGHQGIVKTKERLRTKVWWPGIDRQAELKCKTCHGCQIVSQLAAPPPVKSTPLPSSPWEHLAADLLGPLPTGESLLVTVDYYSRYFEVDILHSTTSKVIISRLRTQFARHGIPHSLRTDNGPQFVSDEFRQFLSEMGIQHRRNTPLWPRANGEVERQNRTLLKTLKIAHAEQKNWNIELQRFLLAYRTTPHTTTGESPSKLLFGRDIRSKLPDLALFNENPNQPSAVRDNDSARKQAAKDRSDSRFNAKERDLEPGDKVLVRNDQPTNKLSTPFLPTPCKILDRHGDQLVIEKADHSIIRRNLHHAKRFLEEENEEKTDEDEAKDQDAAETADEATAEDAAQTADEVKDQDAAETVETPVTPTPSTCRPKRNTAPPARFKDFVTSFR